MTPAEQAKHDMQTEWEKYLAQVFPEGSDAHEEEALRLTFYGGMMMGSIMLAKVASSTDSPDVVSEYVNGIVKEVQNLPDHIRIEQRPEWN